MSEPLTAALERQAEPQAQRDIRGLLERMKPDLQRALQSEQAAEMLLRFYLTAIRLNPQLYECSDESLLGALLLTAQTGLEPGPLGHVYLVPFKTECTWILGYTGILELARRGGVGALRSEIVWDCDEYVAPWSDERGLHWLHKPGPEDEREARVAVLTSWLTYVDGKRTPSALHVSQARIERAKAASPAARKNSGPWTTDEDAMWRKTGVRAARPWLPLEPMLNRAFASDEAVVLGVVADPDLGAQAALEPGDVEAESEA